MKVIVSKNPVKTGHDNVYLLKIVFMSGDADAYETIEVVGDRDQIEPALRFLSAMDRAEADSKDRYYSYMCRLNNTGHYNNDRDWTVLDCAYVAGHFGNYLSPPDDAPRNFARIEWPRDQLNSGDLAARRRWSLEWHHGGSVYPCTVEHCLGMETDL